MNEIALQREKENPCWQPKLWGRRTPRRLKKRAVYLLTWLRPECHPHRWAHGAFTPANLAPYLAKARRWQWRLPAWLNLDGTLSCAECWTPMEEAGAPPYLGLCAGCAWRKWFSEAGKGWADVDCIECELGRRCLKEPPCPGAEVDDE